jgi:hypothetical protein
MAKTIRIFRDRLSVDYALIAKLNPSTWDTVVCCARQVTLSALMPNIHYVIAADELIVAANAATSLIGSPSIAVMAGQINGLLHITSAGIEGEPGIDGEPGESGVIEIEGRRPVIGPGGAGGPGGNGGNGTPGGTVRILYESAAQTPIGSAPGGAGGPGGQGGPGGAGRPPGRPGRPGRPGAQGASGTVEVRQVVADDLRAALDQLSRIGWAAYRAEVAGYFFRKFDPESQMTALRETASALLLNPADPEAATIHSRILNRQIPTGLPRDLDIAADFPELSANLPAEVAVVQGVFGLFADMVTWQGIAASLWTQLSAMQFQLRHRQEEAQADVTIAQQDVLIAKAEQTNLQTQIDQLQQDIDAIRNQSLSFGDLVATVGSIAGMVAGIATGAGAIISVPAGLAALERIAGQKELGLGNLLGELKNAAKDPKHPTTYEYDVAKAAGIGGGLKDLVSGGKSLISFLKVIDDLDRASSQPGQGSAGQLLKQQAVLVRQKMVASLREKQGESRVAVARLRVNNLAAEIAQLEQLVAQTNRDDEMIKSAADAQLRAARQLVDMVMEDVFLAQRAREIYMLGDTPGLRFDFGYIHPDDDRDKSFKERAKACVENLATFAIQVLSWTQMFQELNAAQIGFDVVHPQLSLTITDPAQLAAFAAGGTLQFSIPASELPSGMFELKANALSMEMRGASATRSANVWVKHSGEWAMNRRADGSITVMTLRPRSEVFAFGIGSGTLTASIPAHPQSGSEPGPPFSFWGRGVLTTFTLRLASPAGLNLSALNAVHITVDCIAFAPQGGPALAPVTTIRPQVQLVAPSPSMVVEAAAALV